MTIDGIYKGVYLSAGFRRDFTLFLSHYLNHYRVNIFRLCNISYNVHFFKNFKMQFISTITITKLSDPVIFPLVRIDFPRINYINYTHPQPILNLSFIDLLQT